MARRVAEVGEDAHRAEAALHEPRRRKRDAVLPEERVVVAGGEGEPGEDREPYAVVPLGEQAELDLEAHRSEPDGGRAPAEACVLIVDQREGERGAELEPAEDAQREKQVAAEAMADEVALAHVAELELKGTVGVVQEQAHPPVSGRVRVGALGVEERGVHEEDDEELTPERRAAPLRQEEQDGERHPQRSASAARRTVAAGTDGAHAEARAPEADAVSGAEHPVGEAGAARRQATVAGAGAGGAAVGGDAHAGRRGRRRADAARRTTVGAVAAAAEGAAARVRVADPPRGGRAVRVAEAAARAVGEAGGAAHERRARVAGGRALDATAR